MLSPKPKAKRELFMGGNSPLVAAHLFIRYSPLLMAPTDDTGPATKADVERILAHISRVQKRFDNYPTKDEMNRALERMENRLLTVFENLRKGVFDANREDFLNMKDRHRDHEERIVHLERHAGISHPR